MFRRANTRRLSAASSRQSILAAACEPLESRLLMYNTYDGEPKWGFADQRPAQAGHFVGMSVHDVGDYAAPFRAGMVIAVEPIIAARSARPVTDPDGWTLRTHNGALAAHFEHTVVVTQGEPEILTAA